MYADRTINLIKFRMGRWIEIVSYTIFSFSLIGQIFYVDYKITALNILLVFAGVIVGFMVSCGWTPLTNKLRDPEIVISADVSSFISHRKETHKYTNEDQKAA